MTSVRLRLCRHKDVPHPVDTSFRTHAVGIEKIPQARTFWLEGWRSTPASVYGRTGPTSHRASTTELAPPQAIPRRVAPTADDEAGPAPAALNLSSDDALTSWKPG